MVDTSGNWDAAVDFCAGGLIPGSEYLWMAAIIISAVAAMIVSRWMVSKF